MFLTAPGSTLISGHPSRCGCRIRRGTHRNAPRASSSVCLTDSPQRTSLACYHKSNYPDTCLHTLDTGRLLLTQDTWKRTNWAPLDFRLLASTMKADMKSYIYGALLPSCTPAFHFHLEKHSSSDIDKALVCLGL